LIIKGRENYKKFGLKFGLILFKKF
jgi:hypothetical protein